MLNNRTPRHADSAHTPPPVTPCRVPGQLAKNQLVIQHVAALRMAGHHVFKPGPWTREYIHNVGHAKLSTHLELEALKAPMNHQLPKLVD